MTKENKHLDTLTKVIDVGYEEDINKFLKTKNIEIISHDITNDYIIYHYRKLKKKK